MNFIIPILGAVFQAGSFTLDKIVLSVRNVNFKTYTGISFPLIFFITLIIFFIFKPPLYLGLFAKNLWLLILASVIITIVTNLFFYRALDQDKLNELQVISLLQQIPVIIFASIIFRDERNFLIIILTLIASLAVVWSHWERHHFKIAKRTLPYLLWSVTIVPLSAPIYKMILMSWHPISLELVRTGLVALVLLPLFYKSVFKVSAKAFYLLLATNFLSALAWILLYTSYQRFGVVYTTLLFSLQPLLVYFASVLILKESFHWKKAVAFGLVMGSIVAAQVIG